MRILITVSMILAWSPQLFGQTETEKSAVKALRSVSSNIQMNRDGTVRFVRLSHAVVKDDHLIHLRKFHSIDYLAVVTPQVTDAGLANIADLTNLDTLLLADSGLTSEGMQYLKCLTKLERLYLDRTNLSDSALKHLHGLAELKALSLDGVSIGDEGVKELEHLKKLEFLSLCDTQITNESMSSISSLGSLRVLFLDGCDLDGTTLDQLATLDQLESISLRRTRVTSDHLNHLSALKKLRSIAVHSSPVSVIDVAELSQQLPGVTVYVTPGGKNAKTSWQRFLSRELHEDVSAEPSSGKPRVMDLQSDIHSQLDVSDAVPEFQRHIIPLLGKLGCNGRSCHGSFQGQAGFRLSMFGYDFASDHEALAGGESPRVDTEFPAESLILEKPTTKDHGGGIRFKPESSSARLLLRWIQSGARGTSTPEELVRLELSPSEIVFQSRGERAEISAIAVWADGTREDVTPLTRFQSNDIQVAEVSASGTVSSKGPGDTSVIAFYDNAVVPVQVMQPFAFAVEATDSNSEPISNHAIDGFVGSKLRKLSITPSELSDDEVFLRRVYLDLIGTLPTVTQIGEFVADESSQKRVRVVERLLETTAYAEWWGMWLSDLTGSNAQYLGTTDMNRPAADQWTAWLKRKVADNTGWDKIAAGILLAESRSPGQPYDEYAREQSSHLRRRDPTDFSAPDQQMHYYWFRSNNQLATDRALSFGYVFMGVRLQCAQCHKHPFDNWSKQEFDDFAQFFSRIKTGVSPEAKQSQALLKSKLGVPTKLDTAALRRQMYLRVSAEGLAIPWNEVWIEPATSKPVKAKLLGGPELDLSQWRDPREPLVAWLLSKDNKYFSRAFVNRVWARYFGVGIVDPPDDFNLANPASNPDLLNWLAREFVNHNYDMKWLHRTIVTSHAYQRTWKPNDSNRDDTRNFSHALVRRLPAEVAIDAMLLATVGNARAQTWATNLKGRKISQHPKSIQARGIDYSLLVFGKPLRTTNCDCERQMQPTLLQSLFVRNDAEVLDWIRRPEGWIREVMKKSQNTESEQRKTELIRQAYLRTVSREPDQDELREGLEYWRGLEDDTEALEDLVWALLNTREFLTNH